MHRQHPQEKGKDCLSEDAELSLAKSGPPPQSLPRKLPCYFFLRMGLCCLRPRDQPLPGPQLCPFLATEQAYAFWAHLKSKCEVQGCVCRLALPNPSHLPRLSRQLGSQSWAPGLAPLLQPEMHKMLHQSSLQCMARFPQMSLMRLWDLAQSFVAVHSMNEPKWLQCGWTVKRTKGGLLLLGRKRGRLWISEADFSCDA